MASFADLDGAFASLLDTLQNRYSPLLPQEANSRWLGAMGTAASIARDQSSWNSLPEDFPDPDQIAAALDTATRRLASSDQRSEAAILEALDRVDQALALLASFLEGNRRLPS
ncbi:hypothetical protein [Sphingomonas mollis]|uniref:Uncharacterized protein n=1 Tax=Sphingomonas mollis TaxID=2795726 RepID=A0ABS0XUC2_9SPHN|nr:hypothetical protein [Sphingomonas sp. BT553]MBJ6123637.1 hypothetical protein [Sphingomonas sp. BT553]